MAEMPKIDHLITHQGHGIVELLRAPVPEGLRLGDVGEYRVQVLPVVRVDPAQHEEGVLVGHGGRVGHGEGELEVELLLRGDILPETNR